MLRYFLLIASCAPYLQAMQEASATTAQPQQSVQATSPYVSRLLKERPKIENVGTESRNRLCATFDNKDQYLWRQTGKWFFDPNGKRFVEVSSDHIYINTYSSSTGEYYRKDCMLDEDPEEVAGVKETLLLLYNAQNKQEEKVQQNKEEGKNGE